MGKKSKQQKSSSAYAAASPPQEKPTELVIPDNFNEVLYDFVNDLSITFPEIAEKLLPLHSKELPEPVLKEVFMHLLSVFPERFFDILYQNEEMFSETSTVNTNFLPDIDFKNLYHCEGVTETTRNAIWKYLQLILVSILSSIQDKNYFGDAMNMFEGVDEAALQDKLKETIDGIGDFFKHLGVDVDAEVGEDDGECPDLVNEEAANAFFKSMEESMAGMAEGMGMGMAEGAAVDESEKPRSGEMPKPEDLHGHLKDLFDGKIGRLAKELAEEISTDMENMFGEEDTRNIHTTQDLLKKMIKNPKKMMDLMKTIGNKLQQKMKSGEISEQDIMKEAGDILGKMKGLGGKDNKEFAEVFKNLTKTMGGSLGGGKGKMNMGALNQLSKNLATRERLQSKLEQKRTQKSVDPSVNISALPNSLNNYVFTVAEGEKQEKSFARPISQADIEAANSESLDALVAEINNAGAATKGSGGKSGKTGKKKGN